MGLRMGVVVAVLSLFCSDGVASDASISAKESARVELQSEASDLGISPLRMVAIAGLIGALLYLTAIGLKRYSRWSRTVTAGKRSLQVLDSLPLGGRRVLLVTRVYDRILLIGAGEGPLVKLGEIEDPGVVEEALSGEQRGGAADDRAGFQELLSNLSAREITPVREYERIGRRAPSRARSDRARTARSATGSAEGLL